MKKTNILDQLTANDALIILKTLVKEDKNIEKRVEQYEKESTSEYKDWAVDAPLEYFGNVLNEWKKGQKEKKDITEMDDFIKTNFPKWS